MEGVLQYMCFNPSFLGTPIATHRGEVAEGAEGKFQSFFSWNIHCNAYHLYKAQVYTPVISILLFLEHSLQRRGGGDG